ncbi:hypothetical protein WICMUC_005535 [Wickerhamomyces mucosus]|uniref:Aminotransferase class I/classII large domain-containing protein n=1 Tax=Wickerhamomyces mucosus TaxID=1378264 RepID=A0A9P8P6Y7_9ASCO|nr:hypothetical protein WICMUC_005535 [Wickerhamomyces mucosus]
MTYNFFKGHPTDSLYPSQDIVEATTKLLLSPNSNFDEKDPRNRHPLSYGSDEGAIWVRDEIAKFSNKIYQPNAQTESDFLNLTNGSSYGVLNILLQSTLPHTNYTKQAFIITPTYFLINGTFIDAGFNGKLTAIDEKSNSIDLELLETKLKEFDSEESNDSDTSIIQNPNSQLFNVSNKKKIYKFVLYCVPTFSNPGGETYDLETRLKLIELARKYDMLIITDEVYDLLDYVQPLDEFPSKFIPKITHLDRETNKDNNSFGNSIINSTFSKFIAPGLRVGYQETINKNLAYQLSEGGANVSGGTPSQLNSMIVGELLQNGKFKTIVNRFRSVYAERARLLKSLLIKNLPKGSKFTGFEGGYFQWVTLPSEYDTDKIVKELGKEGVILAGGGHFEVTGDVRNWGKTSFRLSISSLSLDEIEKGIELVGAKIKQLYPDLE